MDCGGSKVRADLVPGLCFFRLVFFVSFVLGLGGFQVFVSFRVLYLRIICAGSGLVPGCCVFSCCVPPYHLYRGWVDSSQFFVTFVLHRRIICVGPGLV